MSAHYPGAPDPYPPYDVLPPRPSQPYSTDDLWPTGPLPVVGPRARPQAPMTGPTQRLTRVAPLPPAPVRGTAPTRSSSAHTPLLLRATIISALLVAVFASLVRAQMILPGIPSSNALQLTPSAAAAAGNGAGNAVGMSVAQQSPRAMNSAAAGQAAQGGQAPAGTEPTADGNADPGAQPADGANAQAGTQMAQAGTQAGQGAAGMKAGSGCRVTYLITGKAVRRYAVTVAVQNTGTAAVNGWALRWSLPPGQHFTSAANAAINSDGFNVNATDAGFNRQILPGGRVTFGFTVGPARPAPPATGFALNGVTCA